MAPSYPDPTHLPTRLFPYLLHYFGSPWFGLVWFLSIFNYRQLFSHCNDKIENSLYQSHSFLHHINHHRFSSR
ncbi:hypothetical protein RIF29_29366 [Crotalaria pallida]|uniref:Uncharacterized protein n=1 Tax=Crotalaria pallida TaxID=3830 RepID=A0AAN9HVV6_CROPI